MSLDFQPIKPTTPLRYMEYLGSGSFSAGGSATITHNKNRTYDAFFITPNSSNAGVIYANGGGVLYQAIVTSSNANSVTISGSTMGVFADNTQENITGANFKVYGMYNAGF